ncbi:copper amine oxidase N-terminal domain-containing protein [Paenibacillus sp. R14(2021)]|uniref:copper amine oxidase N-terminal domain-containing protein n=1 Tax=Paenibacillus sp. R14(2021) TaxID=2859228 RepID=UPI001C61568A|nr:copper amine oxidase N-terminal domain-containing protein [Paenibacillus sp. R14(2021)]
MKLKRILVTVIALAAFTALYNTQAQPARAAAANTPASIADRTASTLLPDAGISPDTYIFDGKHPNADFFVHQGTTYLSCRQASAMFRDLVWSYDAKSKSLKISGPNRTLSWKAGSRTAVINGISRRMSAALMVRSGSLSLPLRELANWAGGSIRAYPGQLIGVSYTVRSVLSGEGNNRYWVRRDNGIVYRAAGFEMPHQIGYSAVRAGQYVDMSVSRIDNQTVVLEVTHNYGEPSLANTIYRLLLHEGKLVRASSASYYGVSKVQSMLNAEGLVAMVDGSRLLLVDAAGKAVRTYDLKKLGGKDEDYTVEYASAADDTLVIRPYSSQTLLLVRPDLAAPIILYKELLSKEEQSLFEQQEPNVTIPPRDRLQFGKRTGNTFTFGHLTLSGPNEDLTYTLAP